MGKGSKLRSREIDEANGDEGDELPDDDELGMETLIANGAAPTHREGFSVEVEIGVEGVAARNHAWMGYLVHDGKTMMHVWNALSGERKFVISTGLTGLGRQEVANRALDMVDSKK